MRDDHIAFSDTSFLVALSNVRDRYHAAAIRLHHSLSNAGVPRITTEYVLVEVGNRFSRLQQRRLGAALVERALTERRLEVIPASMELLRAGLELYRNRLDKEWGLTDCISFEVMRRRGITLALTVDRHFVQAGFDAPLLAET